MFKKPFVYFSEAILTPSKTVDVLQQSIKNLGGTSQLDVSLLWRQAALSVRSQASLYRMPGYKGEKYHKWLSGVLDTIADGISFPSPNIKSEFKSSVLPLIGKPRNYFVPDDVKQFISQLNAHEINWGVLANESHIYPAILKSLNLQPPGPLLLASGPTMFKPLPKMWLRAIERVPVASKHDVWFIGSSNTPCDNMAHNPSIRCVLVKPELKIPDNASQHFRVAKIYDILPHLLSNQVSGDIDDKDTRQKGAIDLAFLDHDIEPDSNNIQDKDEDVTVSSYIPVPPLQGKENNVAEYLNKSSSR